MDIKLNDGTLVDVKVSFLTIKLMGEHGILSMQKKASKNPEDEELKILLASKMMYIILRSSGLKIDEEEALSLIDDTQTMELLMEDFSNKMEKFKKKQAKMMPKTK